MWWANLNPNCYMTAQMIKLKPEWCKVGNTIKGKRKEKKHCQINIELPQFPTHNRKKIIEPIKHV